MYKKSFTRFIAIVGFVVFAVSLFVGCQEESVQTLVFGDLSWDSAQIHNRIAAFIIENGIGGYKAEYTAADTLVTINGITTGDIDIDMESWHSNFREVYDKAIAAGSIVDLGKNIPDAPQGWWVPRYLIEGEDALAPDLESVSDLPQYWELFKDPEDNKKGIVYLGVAGWASTKVSEDMFAMNNLGENYNQGIPGSSAALAATMVGAYEKKEPWVGYYWAPTALLGRLDMVRLKGSEYPPADVNILVAKDLSERAPDVVAFLKNYSTTIEDNNEFLAKKEEMDWDAQETALWFLREKEDAWTPWVSDEVAVKVKAAL
ncbi:MAG: hypothetical protein B0D92_07030 [Spirochaeta sp. LUC14_002_19_P3]|nr:MAG: hypothetical protein B0D92_07030 [Spirochaeta sp. LUC14_002_19_P3]